MTNSFANQKRFAMSDPADDHPIDLEAESSMDAENEQYESMENIPHFAMTDPADDHPEQLE